MNPEDVHYYWANAMTPKQVPPISDAERQAYREHLMQLELPCDDDRVHPLVLDYMIRTDRNWKWLSGYNSMKPREAAFVMVMDR